MTILQRWQRDRFMFKGHIAGCIVNLKGMVGRQNISPDEQVHINRALKELDYIQHYWDINMSKTRSQAKRRQTLNGQHSLNKKGS